jgi:hypothetical protein
MQCAAGVNLERVQPRWRPVRNTPDRGRVLLRPGCLDDPGKPTAHADGQNSSIGRDPLGLRVALNRSDGHYG